MCTKATRNRLGVGKLVVIALGVCMVGICRAETVSGGPDAVTFITGGDLGSTAILSINANSPDTVFEGVSLDDCEAFHKAVRSCADDVDYDFMEVSSPGIDRPLKTDRDFERNLGCEIEVRLYRPVEGTKVLTGVLAGLEEGNIVIDTDEGRTLIPRKDAALVKPVVDMEGIEDVDLSGDEEENNTET